MGRVSSRARQCFLQSDFERADEVEYSQNSFAGELRDKALSVSSDFMTVPKHSIF